MSAADLSATLQAKVDAMLAAVNAAPEDPATHVASKTDPGIVGAVAKMVDAATDLQDAALPLPAGPPRNVMLHNVAYAYACAAALAPTLGTAQGYAGNSLDALNELPGLDKVESKFAQFCINIQAISGAPDAPPPGWLNLCHVDDALCPDAPVARSAGWGWMGVLGVVALTIVGKIRKWW